MSVDLGAAEEVHVHHSSQRVITILVHGVKVEAGEHGGKGLLYQQKQAFSK